MRSSGVDFLNGDEDCYDQHDLRGRPYFLDRYRSNCLFIRIVFVSNFVNSITWFSSPITRQTRCPDIPRSWSRIISMCLTTLGDEPESIQNRPLRILIQPVHILLTSLIDSCTQLIKSFVSPLKRIPQPHDTSKTQPLKSQDTGPRYTKVGTVLVKPEVVCEERGAIC